MSTSRNRKVVQTVAAILEDSTPDTPRAAILNEAMEITHKDRNSAYGDPEDNFRNIAVLWTGYLQAKVGTRSKGFIISEVNSHDVAIMMVLMKTARLATNSNHHDSAVDIAGYAACLGDIQVAAQSSAITASEEAAMMPLREQPNAERNITKRR